MKKKVYGGGRGTTAHTPLDGAELEELKNFLRAELEKDLVAVGGCRTCYEEGGHLVPPGQNPIIAAMCPVANKHCKRCNTAHGAGY